MKQRILTFAALVAAIVVAFAGAAFAAEVVEEVADEDGDAMTMTSPEVVTDWDDENGVLVISIGVADDSDGTDGDGTDGDGTDDGEPAGPCDGVTWERGDDGELVVNGGEELPEGCLVFDGVGKDGKVNGGTVTSAVARMLSPHDLDVPKGWIMREVAKVKPTKVKAKDAMVEDEAADASGESGEVDEGPKGKAKGHDKAKANKANKADKSNKGKRGG